MILARPRLCLLVLLGGALGVSCTLIDWDYRVHNGFGGGSATGGGSAASGMGGNILPADHGWPDSATTYCADGSMAVACPTPAQADYHGQDGDYPLLVPTYQLANAAGGSAFLDSVSGLFWEADFSAIAAADLSFAAAKDHCKSLRDSNYAGVIGWRLPSPRELATLLDGGHAASSFPQEFDPLLDDATKNSSFYWTSAAATGSTTTAWAYSFVPASNGLAARDKTVATGGRAICVAGNTNFADPVLIVNGAVVDDTSSHLTWQPDMASSPQTWTDALKYCAALSVGGVSGFRLPSVKELLSIVSYYRVNPAIDPNAFPNTPPERFWTSTPYAADPTQAWYVDFATGAAAPEPIGMTTQQVRCVR